MIKLNFGCGQRFARGWVNIDFHSAHPDVQRVNLLRRWPFPDCHFDAVYSSHTLEHFTSDQAETLVSESRRVLKPGGILRTVVPDLENICREYLRILDQIDSSPLARRQYEWIILELLDQLTRTNSSSPMTQFRNQLAGSNDREMIGYVQSRTDTNRWEPGSKKTLGAKLRALTLATAQNKVIYLYLALLKKLIPSSLRQAVIDDTRIGEKHKWMYDRHNLGTLMTRSGLCEVVFLQADRSEIPGFNKDLLDINPDGSAYKCCSLYCEAKKN